MEESDMHANTGQVHQIMQPLVIGGVWMKLLAVVWIIGGVLQALTIIGILVAWLPIWLGVLLFQAASAAERAAASGDTAAAIEASNRLRVFFMIQGILMLIAIAFFAFVFLTGGLAMMGAMSRMN
jgi:hypothetical protein